MSKAKPGQSSLIDSKSLKLLRDDTAQVWLHMHQNPASTTTTGTTGGTRTKIITEGGLLKALEKYSGDQAKYNDWVFNVHRVLLKYSRDFEDLLGWASTRESEILASDVMIGQMLILP